MNFFSHITISFFAVMLLAAAFGEEVLSRQITYVPESVSKLWIEGRSNINEFECQANQYFAEATLFDLNDNVEFIRNENDRVFLQVEIRVDGFECGRSRMNRDLRDALKSEQFPEIIFMFDSAELLGFPEDEDDDAFEILVRGSLTVAGNKRDVQFTTKAYYVEVNKVRAIGKTTIRMTDFDVTPPTALMGLIQANDELTVNFDLIARETEGICQLCPTRQQM